MISTALRTEQNALSVTAELVLARNSARKFAEITNLDASIAIYLGMSDAVTTSNGHKLAAGLSFGLEDYHGPVYAVAASGTPSVSVVEW